MRVIDKQRPSPSLSEILRFQSEGRAEGLRAGVDPSGLQPATACWGRGQGEKRQERARSGSSWVNVNHWIDWGDVFVQIDYNDN